MLTADRLTSLARQATRLSAETCRQMAAYYMSQIQAAKHSAACYAGQGQAIRSAEALAGVTGTADLLMWWWNAADERQAAELATR